MICCVCVNKCEKEIKKLVREGCNTIVKFKKEHGVSAHCGMCEPYVNQYIKEETMKGDITKLIGYLEGHQERLDNDIQNALKKDEDGRAQYYTGAQDTTKMAVRLLKEIVERNDSQ